MPHSDALRRFKADIFQALAHPTRIAIAEALHRGELSAGEIIQLLELEQANASQHLAVLRSKQIVMARKKGNQVFYSLRDRALGEVLDSLRGYFQRHLREIQADLKEVSRLEARTR
ncbi:MAG TPA: metalloregulator ArsR/SmtB family transcription factor [Candidatus Methylacidiphilales bacterium]|nr:metalloregulator ArsR/SmtB family transcription factor [Candidatus Methylacidiphilales bacterium]